MDNVAVAAYIAMLVAADAIWAGAKNAEVTTAVERVAIYAATATLSISSASSRSETGEYDTTSVWSM